MEPNKWTRRFLLIAASASFVACRSNPEGIVANVGSYQITTKEFRVAYELASPSSLPVTGSPLERKRYFLDRMVERKVLALAGIAEGLDTTETGRRVIAWEQRQALIRALYRTNIEAGIEVTDDDLREAFILSSQVLVLRQIRVWSEQEARAIYDRILAGEDFESIAIERAPPGVPPARILEPREFNWGDLDDRLETAAFGLSHMEVSAPIETPTGFHIIQLVDRRQQLMLTEAAFEGRRSYLETMIRRQRGAAASENYLKTLASGRTARVRSETVVRLSETARRILTERSDETPMPQTLQVRELEGKLGELGLATIATFDADDWAVDDFIRRVAAMPPEDRPDLTVPASSAKAIATLVRDDYLVAEARRQGLEDDPIVVEDVMRVREELASHLKRAELYREIEISDADVRSFYLTGATRYQIPERVRIREVMVRSESLADSILAQVRRGSDIEDLARRYSVRTWAAERGGDLGPITEEAFGSVGVAAFAAAVGELVGPVPVLIDSIAVGYSVFRVSERIPAEMPQLESIEDRVERDAHRAAQEGAIATFMAGTADRWPVAKDDEALVSIRTTDESAEGRPMDMVLVKRAN